MEDSTTHTKNEDFVIIVKDPSHVLQSSIANPGLDRAPGSPKMLISGPSGIDSS